LTFKDSFRYRIQVAYDGTQFFGISKQNRSKKTICSALDYSLSRLFGSPVVTKTASRTDSGVSALGQNLHFDAPLNLPPKAIIKGVLKDLPESIRIIKAELSPGFHAQHHSIAKWYRYHIFLGQKAPLPISFWSWAVSPCDFGLHEIQKVFFDATGEHDFTSFRAAGCDASHATRFIHSITVQPSPIFANLIYVDIIGNAFVRKMVRNLVGTAVEIAQAKIKIPMAKVIAAKDRSEGGKTAPGKGLCLMEIYYQHNWKKREDLFWI